MTLVGDRTEAENERLSLELPPDPLVGQVLDGRYRLDRTLGAGGVGLVYGGVHVDLGRPVAVKVLGPAWAADPLAVRRFEREARALSKLRHPNIVEVFDFGRTADGRPYLVMEWLEGETLADYFETRLPLSPRESARLLDDAASALDAVHAKGVVHRDVKPENLFLARTPTGEPVLKLIDFGLVGLLFDAEQPRLTRQGLLYGTPEYMAPEVTVQDVIDHRADIYALGVTTFEMLTGQLPFQGGSPFRLLAEKRDRAAPRLGQVSQLVFATGIEDAVERALARHPDLRFESAGAFAAALRDAVAGPAIEVDVPRETTEAVVRTMSAPPKAGDDATDELPVQVPGLWSGRRALVLGLAVALLFVGVGVWSFGLGAPPEVSSAPSYAAVEASPAPSPPTTGGTASPVSGEPTESEGSTIVEASPSEEQASRRERPRRERSRPSARPERRQDRPSLSAAVAPPTADAPTEADGRGSAEALPSETERERAAELTREGYVHLARGRLPDAVESFRESLNLAPSGGALRGMGLAQERLRHLPEARRTYQRYLRFAPNAGDADAIRRRLAAIE